jgi:Tfp pilus assembly protein PilW
MVSPTSTRGLRRLPPGVGGFTLLEVMLVTAISSFVFAGVLSAYIFLGRSLARQVNEEGLESRARLALYYFTQDIGTATGITACNPGAHTTGTPITLTIAGNSVAYYCDWTVTTSGTLYRQVGSNPRLKLLTNLSSLSFGYYDPTGSSVTVPTSAPSTPQINIQQVYMAFTTAAGYAASGAQSQFTVVSPTVVMKNKAMLLDPTKP